MSIDWDKLVRDAAAQTDNELSTQLAGLTSLKVSEIDTFIKDSKISNADAVKVLKEINSATASNTEKANAISNIKNGVGFLVSLVGKVV